jgi:DNA-binding SARP family transcriptional activator
MSERRRSDRRQRDDDGLKALVRRVQARKVDREPGMCWVPLGADARMRARTICIVWVLAADDWRDTPVMSPMVRLTGRPQIEGVDGSVVMPRGQKSWAVLAYLVMAEGPVTRERLASLLFDAADDPLGALRWTLAELRRSLGATEALRGDPVSLDLPIELMVDVIELGRGPGDPRLVRGELLEGVEIDSGPVFGAWLLVERRRLAGVCEAVLHQAALSELAQGRRREAAALAARALEYSPFDDGLHELLVRCLAASGDFGAARHAAVSCEVLFRRELGRSPDASVARAADPAEQLKAVGDRAVALGQLRAGLAAIDAGAVEPGIACLRMACAEARALGDQAVLTRAMLELGVALVHAIRGRDEEGAAVLHEVLALAAKGTERGLVVDACRELGYVEVQAGRPAAAGRWLTRASAEAKDDHARAKVLGVRGMALSDRAHYGAAIELLKESVVAAERCGDRRQAAWSLAILGRARLLRGELTEAAQLVDRSIGLISDDGWLSFQPFPEALRAELFLRAGDVERAAILAPHAFALGCQLGDPCWEGLGGRVLGLLHRSRGDHEMALELLRDAVARADRVADPYVWVKAYCLDALASALIAFGTEAEATAVVSELEILAARCDMRELLVRAAMHSARLGTRTSLEALYPLARAIDNPALESQLASLG